LADDSNYCGINPLFVNVSSVGYYDFGAGNIRLSAVSTYSSIFSNWDGITLQTSWAVTAGTVGSENRMFIGASGDASAKLSVTSTTKGFLPPRQTTTQINAIVSPAEGLQIYNTTINHMCFYMNGAWVKINHSPM
jgi:lipid-binding SYLF domain-containing protein